MAFKTNEIQLFLKKTGFFVLLFLIAAIGLEITCNAVIRTKADFTLKSHPEYAVFGNSRPECAFNDSLISHFRNFAESGENYFYTRIKIKNILKQNPGISTVFIEFGNSNIDNTSKEKILDKNDMSYRIPVFSPFLDFDDYNFFFSSGIEAKRNIIQIFPVSLRRKAIRIVRNDFDYTDRSGGYNYLDRNKIDSLVKAYKNITKEPLTGRDIYTESIDYLKEIVDFCNQSGKTTYIIRCPLHPDYPYYVNEKMMLDILENNFSDTQFLDFSKFPSANSEFGDFTHLNYAGAKRFSVWFDKLLKNGLLEKDNPQEFIDLEIQKIIISNNSEN